jgi:lysophospholipase L1-like esterase
VALVAALLIAVASCREQRAVQLAPLAPDARILAFGDSLTFGYGAEPDESYPARLGELLGRPVVSSGVNGETSEQGLARLPVVLDREAPALLLLCLGGNDFLRRLDEARTETNLARMIEIAQERGVAVVLIAVPRLNLLSSLRGAELYARLARRYGVPLENDAIAAVLSERELLSDRIHPNARGYARIAESIRDLLRGAGAV